MVDVTPGIKGHYSLIRFFVIGRTVSLEPFHIKSYTRIMINKGMVNKGKYWIFEKNKGAPVSYFGDLKDTHKGFQCSISF